ncbi:hypothetical protein ACFV7R_31150 [Streptomyces sp. NPDC059866]|uniref:hypothetical protein n=1 Tax=Streptomyces sp. NPDC059866 TaxID=3346978 RepID=UPI003660965F
MYALILPASTPFVLLATVMALSWWEDHILPAPPAEPGRSPRRGVVQELGERLKRHGSLTEQPLSPAVRERYVTQWAIIQEQFVASPQQAVTEADALLARLARGRGFPDGEQFEDQIAALSVRHAHYVQGYRSMHAAARGQSSTEEIREAMVEAQSLFEALVTEQPAALSRPTRRPPTAKATRCRR